jgi:glycerol uptake facilitator-like aquaporin
MGMTLPGAGYSVLTVFLVETFITSLLVSIIFSFLHKNYLTRYAGIAGGVLVAVLVYLTANISGTSMNPARSFGPALAAFDFSFLWIYLLAPMAGSLIAASVQWMILPSYKPLCAKLNRKKEQCLYENCEFCNPNR